MGKKEKESSELNSHRADAVLGRDSGGLVRVELVLLVERGKRGEERRGGVREEEKRARRDHEERPLSRKEQKLEEKLEKKTHGLDLGAVLRSQLVDERRDHPAGPAPGRPEVDEHGHGGLEDILLPGGVSDGA